eukprot:scaffold85279_cov24-Tisochrysis_lutea.AAC.1
MCARTLPGAPDALRRSCSHLLTRVPLGDVEGLRKFSKVVRDLHLLQVAPVGREPLVERDCVALDVLPVGDAWRNLPVLLVLGADLARRRVHDGDGRRGRATGNPLVLEFGWLERVNWRLDHPDHAVRRASRVSTALV